MLASEPDCVKRTVPAIPCKHVKAHGKEKGGSLPPANGAVRPGKEFDFVSSSSYNITRSMQMMDQNNQEAATL